ncbi:unnamed protein product [Symbiodinium sp. CCMP2592]|nr:unnamed protein product [Symbiodinium sp. CCMP2592]
MLLLCLQRLALISWFLCRISGGSTLDLRDWICYRPPLWDFPLQVRLGHTGCIRCRGAPRRRRRKVSLRVRHTWPHPPMDVLGLPAAGDVRRIL